MRDDILLKQTPKLFKNRKILVLVLFSFCLHFDLIFKIWCEE